MNRKTFFEYLCGNTTVLIVFITGNNCAFCDAITPYVELKKGACHFPCLHIDREKDADVYSLLMAKKQIKGVPSLLAYSSGNCSVYANVSISGINKNEINEFFDGLDFL